MLAFRHHRNKSLKYLMKIKSYWTSWYQNITANETKISIVLSSLDEEQEKICLNRKYFFSPFDNCVDIALELQ